MAIAPNDAQAQRMRSGEAVQSLTADCLPCDEIWDGYMMWHYFPIFGSINVDPRTGHGPHGGTSKQGWCAGSHGGCPHVPPEDLDALAAGLDLERMKGVLDQLGSRTVVDEEAGLLRILDCEGAHVMHQIVVDRTVLGRLVD